MALGRWHGMLSIRSGIMAAIEQRLSLLRDSCQGGGSCVISRTIFEFHAMRYNILESAGNVVERGKAFGRASIVGKALTEINQGWNPTEPFRLESV